MQRPMSEATLKFAAVLAGVALLMAVPASAQSQRTAPTPQPPPQQTAPAIGGQVSIPGFWDPKRRPERPDMSRITVIRFMT